MSDVSSFKFQEQQDYLGTLANVVFADAAFSSGTTTTDTSGFGECRKGTILVTTVSSATTVYLVTAVASDKKITGKQISNAA
ncbi:MAG: hypothetical protein Q4C86_10715 [bacterium]|nr:hypothetical protein [bacterium]